MADFRLHNSRRIRSAADFAEIYAAGSRLGDQNLLLFARRNGQTYTRFGVSVSRKHGNAVQRVRKKRRLREAFRLAQHELPPGLDLILIPRHKPDVTLQSYQRSLCKLAQRLVERLPGDA